MHGHGFLDEARWNWLQAELADSQAANQLIFPEASLESSVQASAIYEVISMGSGWIYQAVSFFH